MYLSTVVIRKPFDSACCDSLLHKTTIFNIKQHIKNSQLALVGLGPAYSQLTFAGCFFPHFWLVATNTWESATWRQMALRTYERIETCSNLCRLGKNQKHAKHHTQIWWEYPIIIFSTSFRRLRMQQHLLNVPSPVAPRRGGLRDAAAADN